MADRLRTSVIPRTMDPRGIIAILLGAANVLRFSTKENVASFFPFHTTYWLNGHSFMEQELKRKQIGFRKRQRFSGDRRCRGAASRRRPAQPTDHPQTTRLLDAHPRTEILKEGTQPDEPVAVLFDRTDRVLPELHFQTPFSHPQNSSSGAARSVCGGWRGACSSSS